MSRVVKAHQLAFSEPWRPQIVEVKQPATEDAEMRGEADPIASLCLERAEARAKEIIDQANAKAEQILNEAKRAAEQVAADAYKAGYSEGWQAGESVANAEVQAAWSLEQEEIREFIGSLVAKDRQLLQEAEVEVLKLALAVAERVVGCKLQSDDTVIKSAVRQVLKAAWGCREAVLSVAAEDFPKLWPMRLEWQAQLPGVKDFTLQADPSLKKGDLVLITNQGTLDARVEAVLEQVAMQLDPGGEAE